MSAVLEDKKGSRLLEAWIMFSVLKRRKESSVVSCWNGFNVLDDFEEFDVFVEMKDFIVLKGSKGRNVLDPSMGLAVVGG